LYTITINNANNFVCKINDFVCNDQRLLCAYGTLPGARLSAKNNKALMAVGKRQRPTNRH
jgi:hypothetical protein